MSTNINKIESNRRNKGALAFLICVLSAAAVLTVCTKSSPIYPFNDWVDANCFMTVGKSMVNGLVPYRDIYEQKGSMLYGLYALASMISDTSFLGAYFIEILAAAVFLFYSYRIAEDVCGEKAIVLIPLLAAAVYSSKAFFHGGSAEELCLPLFAYSLMVGERSVRNKRGLTVKECYFVGLTSGCVLWIKYSLLGFYIGWIIVPAIFILKRENIGALLKALAAIVAGVITATVPVAVYFGLNGAISDCIGVYFQDNMSLYTKSTLGPLLNVAAGVKLTLTQAIIPSLLIAAGFVWNLRKKENALLLHRLFALTTAGVLIFVGGQRYPYYPLALTVFAAAGLEPIMEIVSGCRMKCVNRVAVPISLALCTAAAYLICPNTYLLDYEKTDMPQYKFREIICSEDNPTLLNYGFLDGGFYTVCDIVPDCKFFCTLNIPLEEMFSAQEEYVEAGATQFVVTRNDKLQSDKYENVSKCSVVLEGREYTYYLYKLM